MILIIDSNVNELKSLQEEYMRLGFVVHISVNFQDAFELIKTNKIEVVLTSTVIENNSGIDFLQKIRDYDDRILRVLMVGAHELGEMLYVKHERICNSLLSKPFSRNDLMEAVMAQ